MCGIAGFFEISSRRKPEDLELIGSLMSATLAHRGPDDQGIWLDPECGLVLTHRRLSVIDLSASGHQPMVSSCGRYVLVLNGEIYNFRELRQELEESGIAFQGHSDTEVLLAAISRWGLVSAVKRSLGMFAFALWDKRDKTLFLGRDRLGEKPLYYGWNKNIFFFASELKALRKHPDWQGTIDQEALGLYFKYNYVPAPFSIYQGIFKLPAGHILALGSAEWHNHLNPRPQAYWALSDYLHSSNPLSDEKQALQELDVVLRKAVSGQMTADVPLGAFLSGGIDSSIIVALMQSLSSRPVKTFTIGFSEKAYNEAEQAACVARHLKTEHHELYVTPEEARKVIPDLPKMYDEPFADSSQIPTFLVSRLAKTLITVSLSGDGGDELFGGYNRYFWGRQLWNKIQPWPMFLRKSAATLLTSVPPQSWDNFFKFSKSFLPKTLDQRNPGDKIHKLAKSLDAADPDELHDKFSSFWEHPAGLLVEAPGLSLFRRSQTSLTDLTERMMCFDTLTYLPDDILVKIDRAAMAVSLESRVPFLDPRVVEFAWRLPLSMKISAGQGKVLLRRLLYQYVPQEIIDRPKMGFALPIDEWLRGPLRNWAEGYLSEERLKKQGILRPEPVLEKWKQHLSGRYNWQHHLWGILMFEAWFDEYMGIS